MLREVYAPFNRNHDKIITMDVRSAELTKYAANCMLATKISFMNEIAGLADRLGADVEMVRLGIGSDQRIGYHFIYPGAGYGGSCFPKDVKALIHTAREAGFEPTVLQSVEDRNEAQKTVLFDKISRHYGGDLTGRTFALWGLSFKPNTDDMREAASRVLMEALWAAGAKVQAYDPEAMEETQRIYGDRDDLVLCGTKEAALKGADALAILTEWQVFRAPDFDLIREKLTDPVIFDGRNLYDPGAHGAEGLRLLRDRPRPERLRQPQPPPSPPRRCGLRAGLHVLVTGAAGFIGFHVARALMARGDAVTGFDNVNAYYDPALKEARLAELDRAARDDRRGLDLHPGRSRRRCRGARGLRGRPLRPGDPPRRPGRRAPFDREPGLLRAEQPRGLRQHPRGLPPRRDPASDLCLDLERLRREHHDALRGGPGRRPPAPALCRDQARERADGACLRPSLPPALHGPALLHGLRALGPARHGADEIRRCHPRRPADPGLQPRQSQPRLHLSSTTSSKA